VPAVMDAATKLKAAIKARGDEVVEDITVEGFAGPKELGPKDFEILKTGLNTIRLPKTKDLATYAFAAHFAEVRINPRFGELRVTRLVSRCDIGRVLNPMAARSQILGGLVFGIGMALTEQIVQDPVNGRVLSAGITDYWIPGLGMMPEFDIGFVGPSDPQSNEAGAKGAGEIGTVGSAAAIANAVWHATGHRIHSLPISMGELIALTDKKERR